LELIEVTPDPQNRTPWNRRSSFFTKLPQCLSPNQQR